MFTKLFLAAGIMTTISAIELERPDEKAVKSAIAGAKDIIKVLEHKAPAKKHEEHKVAATKKPEEHKVAATKKPEEHKVAATKHDGKGPTHWADAAFQLGGNQAYYDEVMKAPRKDRKAVYEAKKREYHNTSAGKKHKEHEEAMKKHEAQKKAEATKKHEEHKVAATKKPEEHKVAAMPVNPLCAPNTVVVENKWNCACATLENLKRNGKHMWRPKGKNIAKCEKKIRAFIKKVPSMIVNANKQAEQRLANSLKHCGKDAKCPAEAYKNYGMHIISMKAMGCFYLPKCAWKHQAAMKCFASDLSGTGKKDDCASRMRKLAAK